MYELTHQNHILQTPFPFSAKNAFSVENSPSHFRQKRVFSRFFIQNESLDFFTLDSYQASVVAFVSHLDEYDALEWDCALTLARSM